MGRVSWSDQAETDLQSIQPAIVRGQLRSYAEENLHHIPPILYSADEGAYEEIMWHRAIGHERPMEQDGPQNYFLLYREQARGSEFEILAVCSLRQMASMWIQMTS